MPEDLTGKRVLDIGAWNGCLSFECERRGAREVIALGPASSIPFTPFTSACASPRSSAPSRSANSPSFIGSDCKGQDYSLGEQFRLWLPGLPPLVRSDSGQLLRAADLAVGGDARHFVA